MGNSTQMEKLYFTFLSMGIIFRAMWYIIQHYFTIYLKIIIAVIVELQH